MNPRSLVAIVGVATVLLALVGLVYPSQIMPFSNLAPLVPTNPAAAYGEIRAVYGGMLLALGGYTLWAATNPWRHRQLLNLVGTAWLCVFAGRMLGVAVDGSPGLVGWGNAALELVAAVNLLAAPVVGSAPEALPAPSAAAPEPS